MGVSEPPTLMAISTGWSEPGGRMSPKCLYEEPDRTFTVRKPKENDISAHAAVHSKTAYDDVGDYGQGAEQKYRRELPVNHKQAQFRLVQSSLQVQNPIEGSVIPRKVPAWRALFSELE